MKCATQGYNILDKCYGNVADAFVAKPKPPLSNCDHNTIHLIPIYKTLLKRSKPQTKTVLVWSDDNIKILKGCFACTDWELFHNMDIEDATETITDYIKFCVDTVVEKKTINVFPNNKSCITNEIKECLNRNKLAFNNKVKTELKLVQKELNGLLKEARKNIEHIFYFEDSRKLWDSMKFVTNMEPDRKRLITSNEQQRANYLKYFFLRFESPLEELGI